MYRMIKGLMIFILSCTVIAGVYVFHEYMKLDNISEATLQNNTNMNHKYTSSNHAPSDFPEVSNILLLGIDTGEFGRTDQGRSDTMIVAHVDTKKKTGKLISLERDTYVEIAGKNKKDKLNAAYAYGGPEMAIETTEKLLDTTIPYYMAMNMKGVESLLEVVGDIEVDNDFAFQFEQFDFPKGTLTLTPEEALAWSRMRYDDPNGNYGRQIRQQKVIQAMLGKLLKVQSLPKIDKILDILGENMKTNLPLDQLFKMYLTNKTAYHITTDQLKGEEQLINGTSYQKMSEAELERISRQLK
ncbi:MULTISPECIES: LCP family protein [unclassified Enterococcus]|uniref:LCP family protein n=1 Tax=unclassified Enterococcus TaxID=2608891 RepID=UPI0013EBA2B1|nr:MULTISPECIES: LCP family protein [unclassified Enterococcus]